MSYTFNDKHLHTTPFKLISNDIPQLKKVVEKVDVAGRNGSLYIDKKAYENRLIECEHLSVDFKESQYGILFSLYAVTTGELIFDSDPNFKWIVDHVELDTVTVESNKLYSYTSTFHCKPFRKKVEEQSYNITNNSVTVTNTGLEACFPNFEITPHDYKTDISIQINSASFTIHDVMPNEKVYVYGDELNVVQGEELLETSGEFPNLELGKNTVSSNGSSQTATFTLNERFA
jgi:phage-related protein